MEYTFDTKDLIKKFISEINEYWEALEIVGEKTLILGNNWEESFRSLEEAEEPSENDSSFLKIEKLIEKKIEYIRLIDEQFKRNKRNWNYLPFNTIKQRRLAKEKVIEELKISHNANFYPQFSVNYDSDDEYYRTSPIERVRNKRVNRWNRFLGKAIKTMTMSELESFVNEEKNRMLESFRDNCLENIREECYHYWNMSDEYISYISD